MDEQRRETTAVPGPGTGQAGVEKPLHEHLDDPQPAGGGRWWRRGRTGFGRGPAIEREVSQHAREPPVGAHRLEGADRGGQRRAIAERPRGVLAQLGARAIERLEQQRVRSRPTHQRDRRQQQEAGEFVAALVGLEHRGVVLPRRAAHPRARLGRRVQRLEQRLAGEHAVEQIMAGRGEQRHRQPLALRHRGDPEITPARCLARQRRPPPY